MIPFMAPNKSIGIEFHSGSWGICFQLQSGCYGLQAEETKNKIIVIVGDGELDEGSIGSVSCFFSLQAVTL
jgi:transketolase N-terminal domain/subunit